MNQPHDPLHSSDPHRAHLNAIMEALLQVTTPQQVAEVVVEHALTALQASASTLYLLHEDHLENLQYRGDTSGLLEEDFREVPLTAQIPATAVLRTGETLILTAAELLEQYPDSLLLKTHPQAGLVLLPLRSQDETIGVLGLVFEHALPENPVDIQFMNHLAFHCAQALERTWLIRRLQSSEERFRSLLEATTTMVWTRDGEGRFVQEQPSWEAFTGQPWEEYQGRGWQNAIHPEDRETARENFLKGIEGKIPYQNGYRLRQHDGSYRWMQVHAVPVLGEDGQVKEWMGFHRDITEEREASQAALDSEARLFGIISTVSDAVITTDASRRVLVFNHAAERMFGLSAREATGESLDRFIPQRFRRTHAHHMEAFGQTGVTSRSMHSTRSALPALRADGTEFLVEATISQVVVGGERLFTAVVRDVTEQIRVEGLLRESEERFRATFSQAAVGIAHVGLSGEWLTVNQRLCDIVGYSNTELMGLTFQDITHPEDLDKDLHLLNLLVSGRIQTYDMQKRYIRKDGTLVWVNLTVSLVRTPEGDPHYFISVIEDISSMKDTELQLVQARDELEARVEVRTAELQTLSEQLSERVQELEVRNQETRLLGEMSEMLQACLNLEEAQEVVAQHASLLMPHLKGALFSFGASRNVLEEMVQWHGESSSSTVFTPHECWGLRRGKAFLSEPRGRGLRCSHVHDNGAALCVPLLAQGETVGLLHLSGPAEMFTSRKQRLAQTIAETVALAIVNLRLRETLRMQSIRDPLTGLFNRRYLEETFTREARRAQRHQHSIGMVMLDVDHFKRFNDTYGHEAGDSLLADLGRVLQSSVRGEDVACRYGGEEFTLMLPGASLEQTVQRAEQVRQAISELQVSDRGQMLGGVTASLGVAAYPQHGDQLLSVLRAADFALYRAKQEGRNRVIPAG
ncbi:PAS domain S-box protein [Deinococcus cellulosilyticus]|nr:PAS domain S-box protein [Deinococcus cellulosilyticus]